MNDENAVKLGNNNSEQSELAGEDVESLKKKAGMQNSRSNIVQTLGGLVLILIGLWIDGLPLVVLGMISIVEPRYIRTPRSAATLELINRLESRVAELESRA